MKYSEKMRTLFIGEDSGLHVNNFLWAYNVDSKKLSRILSIPAGAESTGLQVRDEHERIGIYHEQLPACRRFHVDDIGSAEDPLAPLIDKYKAGIGYIGGLPALK